MSSACQENDITQFRWKSLQYRPSCRRSLKKPRIKYNETGTGLIPNPYMVEKVRRSNALDFLYCM